MNRIVEPELLDSLDPSDLEAVKSRSDLRKINWLMGNDRWILRSLDKISIEGLTLLEVGAGDGSLALKINKKFEKVDYRAIDLIPRPANLPLQIEWIQGDLLDPEVPLNADVLIVNLMFHHFGSDDLAALGQRIRQSKIRILIINEPARRSRHLYQLALACLLGFNRITRNDAPISIRAGFVGEELSDFLGLSRGNWDCEINLSFFGAYRMLGLRK